jgi:hypothetical protein
MKIESLSVEIFFPGHVQEGQVERYNQVFDLWYRVWVETRHEVDTKLATPSDNFSRQSEVIGLFYEGRVIGLVCNRYVDIRQTAILSDSFFSHSIWPQAVLDRLPQLGRTYSLASHAFVDPAFRKSSSGLPTKHIVFALSFVQTNASLSDASLAMVRKDKNLHSIMLKSGWELLREDVSWYHIPVDLVVGFPSRKPIVIEPEVVEVIGRLRAGCPELGKNYYERFGLRYDKQTGGSDNEFGNQEPYKKAG